MNRLLRSVLVFGLVISMVVDHSTARCPRSQPRCCSRCEPICPAPTSCPSVVVGDGCGAISSPEPLPCSNFGEAVLTERSLGCTDCLSEPIPFLPSDQEALQEKLPEVLTPTPAAEESAAPETPSEESLEETSDVSTSLPVAPIAVPEPTPAIEEPQPSPAETPAASLVGDRYSSGQANSQPIPAVVPESSQPAEDEAIFGEVAESTPVESPQPTPEPLVPAPTSEEPAPSSNDDVDDIFGPSETTTEEADQPAEKQEESAEELPEQPAEPTEEFSDDPFDPFSQRLQELEKHTVVLSSPGGLKSNQNRTWSDNTESFRCEARLLRITKQNVVLARPTGQRAEVPFSRLSNSDLEFVKQQLEAVRRARLQNSVLGKFASGWPN